MIGGDAGLDVLLALAGVLSIGGGLLLAARATRNAATGFLAAWFGLFGVHQIVNAWEGLTGPHPLGSVPMYLQQAALISFAIAYPGGALTPRRKWWIAWAFIPVVPLALLDSPGWITHAFGPADLLAEVYAMIATILVPAFLASRWIRERGAHARAQTAWVVVPLAFWIVHDALWRFAWYASVWDPPATTAVWKLLVVYAFIGFESLALVGVAALGAWAFARSRRESGEGAKGSRAMAIAVLGIFLVSLVQLAVPDQPRGPVHLTLDTLALAVLFYGVARYRVLDVDLRLRWGVRQGTLAGFFVATFFLVSEGATTFLGETTGSTYAGIAGAALLVFALAPLQRVAERVSARAVPVAGGADAYLAFRRLHIYRAALEGALRDGDVEPREREALRALRRELGVTDEEHALLERDLRADRAPATAAPSA